jgi:predicted RNA-binding protein YlxR (DUF448 family)
MARVKKVPQRICVGCGQTRGKKETLLKMYELFPPVPIFIPPNMDQGDGSPDPI